eukprot:TRINITY_DN2186_c0_g1_i9.p1 TRINITY_DN2186_c0_g1~~TRINITY_DN2186_c0_g1_i9.p1  ORF type:complete len:349 (+),score=121.67 TRINITY_DN2186_c0_g1_i9:120-1049(+)
MTSDQIRAAYDAERAEHEDSPDVLRDKVIAVANILKSAKHAVVYTGAGISTSGGIPDFRGPQGVWTKQDKGEFSFGGKDMSAAKPTYAHYAVTELVRRHLLHFVVTTNMDALHLRSGLLPHLIVELHGCCHREFCEGCGRMVMRNYDILEKPHGRDHYTGGLCSWCGGKYMDTIVHFSDTYRTEMDPLTAMHHAKKADVALVMGTSMNVQGAASYPDKALHNPNGKLIIVNLQPTPYDHIASVRVFARTDHFMFLLMETLQIVKFDRETDCVASWSPPDPTPTTAPAEAPSFLLDLLSKVFPSTTTKKT